MNSSRSIATLLVVLIAFSCCIGIFDVRAEGPFDVDDPVGGGRPRTQGILGGGGSNNGSTGNENALRSGSGFSGDWLTQIFLRVTLDLLINQMWIEEQSPAQPTAQGVPVGRIR